MNPYSLSKDYFKALTLALIVQAALLHVIFFVVLEQCVVVLEYVSCTEIHRYVEILT